MEITPQKPAARTTKARAAKPVDPKPSIVSAKLEQTPAPAKRKTLTKKIAASEPVNGSVKATPMESAGTMDLTDMIATAAYFLAEQRQFAPGYEAQDWAAAEQLIRSSHSTKKSNK